MLRSESRRGQRTWRRCAALLTCAVVAVTAGCGGGEQASDRERAERETAGGPTAPPPLPPGTPAGPQTALPPLPAGTQATAQIVAGRRLVAASGCLARHRIGATGDTDLGSNLSRIGARLPAGAIRDALLNPPAPMPSYRELPRERIDALVAYLAALRGAPSGGESCPDDSDCG